MALEGEAERAEEAMRGMASAANQASPAFDSLLRSIMRLERATNKLSNAKDDELTAEEKQERALMNLRGAGQSAASTLSQLAQSFISVPSAVASSNQAFSATLPVLSAITSAATGFLNSIGQFADALKAWGPIGSVAGGLLKGFTELSKVVVQFGSAGMAQQIQAVQQLVNNYNQLSSVGIAFGGSLEKANEAAAAGGLSLDTFSKIVSKNAENLALLGGSASQGAKNIVGFTKDMPGALRTVYGGFEGLNDAVIDYMANQQRLGIDANRNQAQLRAGAVDYLLNMKELSNLTGKSAKAMQADMERRAKQAAFQTAYANMDEKQKKNFNTALQRLPANAADYLAELAYSAQQGMDVTSEFALKFQAAMPEQARLLRELQQSASTMDPEEFKQRQAQILETFAQTSQQTAKTMGPEMVLQATRGVGGEYFKIINDTIAQTGSMAGQLSGAVKAQADASKETGEILKNMAGGFANKIDEVNTALEGLKGKLEDIALKNFDKTTEAVQLLYGAARFMADKFGEMIDLLKSKAGSVASREEYTQRAEQRGRRTGQPMPAYDPRFDPMSPRFAGERTEQEQTEFNRRQSQPTTPNAPVTAPAVAPAAPEPAAPVTAANVSSTPSTITVSSIDPTAVMTVKAEDLVNAINKLPTRDDMDSHNREMISLLTQIRNQV